MLSFLGKLLKQNLNGTKYSKEIVQYVQDCLPAVFSVTVSSTESNCVNHCVCFCLFASGSPELLHLQTIPLMVI